MEVPPWVSPLCFVPEKNNLGLSKSPGNTFVRPFESKYEYCIFLLELFSFYKKVPFALDHAYFFQNILPQHIPSNPNDISY